MPEYIIATKDIGELKRELALNVIAKKVIELTVANSTETRTVWFLAHEAAEQGDVFYGDASPESSDPTKMYPVYIETEDDALLILSADF